MSTTLVPKAPLAIERRAHLSPEEFRRTYQSPGRPVVITDALRSWKALGRWTPEFFRDQFGDRLVTIDGRQLTLGEFIPEVLSSTPERPAPYFRNQDFAAIFPELVPEIQPLPPYLSPNWLRRKFGPAEASILERCGTAEIYIGGAGRKFPVVHFDYLYTHAFLMQLYGRKQYFLSGPDQTPYLYPDPSDPNRSRIDDVEDPDLEKFPLFAQAETYSLTLEPGETLFVPSGWWHTVRLLSPSITLSVNTANRSNWRRVREDFCRLHAHGRRRRLHLNAYLRLVGARNVVAELFH